MPGANQQTIRASRRDIIVEIGVYDRLEELGLVVPFIKWLIHSTVAGTSLVVNEIFVEWLNEAGILFVAFTAAYP